MLLFNEGVYLEYLEFRKELDYSEVLLEVQKDYSNKTDVTHIMDEVEKRFLKTDMKKFDYFNSIYANFQIYISYALILLITFVIFLQDIEIKDSNTLLQDSEMSDIRENKWVQWLFYAGPLILGILYTKRKQRIKKMTGRISKKYKERVLND